MRVFGVFGLFCDFLGDFAVLSYVIEGGLLFFWGEFWVVLGYFGVFRFPGFCRWLCVLIVLGYDFRDFGVFGLVLLRVLYLTLGFPGFGFDMRCRVLFLRYVASVLDFVAFVGGMFGFWFVVLVLLVLCGLC